MLIQRYDLWINLWITGVEPVDKPVENYVDNSGLWITLFTRPGVITQRIDAHGGSGSPARGDRRSIRRRWTGTGRIQGNDQPE